MSCTSTKTIHSVLSVMSTSFSTISGSFVAFAALALGLWRTLHRWLTPQKGACLPPGPKPAPLIGNMLDFPKANSAATYVNWGKRYNSAHVIPEYRMCTNVLSTIEGDILHASAFGTHVVVLNKLKDAEELLEKRARIYSNRLSMPIVKMSVTFFLYVRGS